MKKRYPLWGVAVLTMLITGCAIPYKRSKVSPQSFAEYENNRSVKTVILHLKGDVYIKTSPMNLTVSLAGDTLLDTLLIKNGLLMTPDTFYAVTDYKIPKNDLLFIEYETPFTNTGIIVGEGLGAVVGMVAAGLTAYCLANPKACFGSCPTFYNDEGELVAEGFSLSFMKNFEMSDLDRIEAPVRDGIVQLKMKNEAYETHLVKEVQLIAVEREGHDVYFDRRSREFIRVGNSYVPVGCHNCDMQKISLIDHDVFVSRADAEDLARHDTLEFLFLNPGGKELAVNFHMRNSLLGTHIMYGLIGLAGRDYWNLISEFENMSRLKLLLKLLPWKKIVNPHILVNGREIGTIKYEGPIAFEDFTLSFKNPGDDTIKISFVEIKGDWEIDQVVLAPVIKKGIDYKVLDVHLPKGKDGYLITYPGQEYTLEFHPDDGDFQFFLKTRGYYYEWQREDWIENADPALSRYLFFHPDSAYRYFARSYEAGDPEAREIFFKTRLKTSPLTLK